MAFMDKQGRVIASKLPKVGEMIEVRPLGPALVEELSHNEWDNYIRLQFQETEIGQFSQTLRFTVV